jgi:hypothetical protein
VPSGGPDHREIVAAVQAEALPYEKNHLRRGDRLAPALDTLNDAWSHARERCSRSPARPCAPVNRPP